MGGVRYHHGKHGRRMEERVYCNKEAKQRAMRSYGTCQMACWLMPFQTRHVIAHKGGEWGDVLIISSSLIRSSERDLRW